MNNNIENLIERLLKRAEIRRSIPRGEPDRISDLLEEAAKALLDYDKLYKDIYGSSPHGNPGHTV
jgi:hypothetical protein